MKTVMTLAEFCEADGLPASAVTELVEVLQKRELVELAKQEARNVRCGQHPNRQRMPLRDAEGEFGEVEASIPAAMFFNWLQRPGFGWEGLTSDEGMRDILRDNPVCRVETVSGKISVGGWGRGSVRASERRSVGASEREALNKTVNQ